MNRYASCKYIETFILTAAFLVLSSTVSRAAQEIDVVWSQSDGIRPEIFFTSSTGGSWSEPVMLSDDYYDNLHPVIDRDSQGTRWVFWRAYDNQKTEIRYTTGSSGNWEETKPLSEALQANNAPSVVIDAADTVWVVWSANDGGMDDIYYAVHKDGNWSKPAQLHETNDVPDILPVIELNDEQLPQVTWKRMEGGRYLAVTSSYDGSGWSEPVLRQDGEQPDDDKVGEEVIELPDFVSNSGLVFVRTY
jgi:hypothetical protein